MTPHQAHQARADGQTQARAAVLAGNRSVRLPEGLENSVDFFSRNSHARVMDGEVEVQHWALTVVETDVRLDGAGIGELDGIVQQIKQHLAEPGRIADHNFRNFW